MLSRGETLDSLVPRLVHSSAGVVLELGPGSGEQLSRYDMEKVTHIYGLEPCLSLIPWLEASIEELGLQDKYTIVPYGVEDLEKLKEYGVEEGGIDTVLSIRVLCSVGSVEEAVEKAYKALKPGGRMVFFEHVRSRNWFPRMLEGNRSLPPSCLYSGNPLAKPPGKFT
jgi:cyclopropane fatty-acyl-phospholipid synthase-like methyltransferase